MSAARIGLLFPGEPPVREMLSLARRAEAAGFESIWVAETRLSRDAIVTASAVAAHTARVRIGTAVINPFTRGAALIAQTMATLDELSGGRAVLGIGPGSPAVLTQQGVAWERPLNRLREYACAIRRLIAGETVSFRGATVSLDDAKLDFEPTRPRIPIYLGVTGTRALELAGEIADGVVLNGLLSLETVKASIELIHIGARRAGRNPAEVEIAASLTAAVSSDGVAARDSLRPLVAEYVARFPHLAQATGIPAELRQQIADAFVAGGPARAVELVDDEILAGITCCGTPEECRAVVAERRAAGVALPLLSLAGGDRELAIETFAKRASA